MLFVLSKYDMKIYSDQDMWDWQKDRHVDQWNRNESPEINTDLYSQLMTNKAAKAIQWGKQDHYNEWCWDNWISTYKKMSLETYLTLYRVF